ncbi:hypothetical protein ACOME3_008203 [Neoechinorhynchus agilis]
MTESEFEVDDASGVNGGRAGVESRSGGRLIRRMAVDDGGRKLENTGLSFCFKSTSKQDWMKLENTGLSFCFKSISKQDFIDILQLLNIEDKKGISKIKEWTV